MSAKEQILKLFSGLNKQDKELIIGKLGELKDNKETVISDDIGNCPYCQNEHTVKNGKHKGNQRYLCKACNRNFIYSTGTALGDKEKKSISTI